MPEHRWAMPYLVPLTPEARGALAGPFQLLEALPLRVGRDQRTRQRFRLGRDRRRGVSSGPNDLYLPESGARLRISREHFLIGRDAQGYYVEDRHSACGTIVAGAIVGGGRRGGHQRLGHGDTIVAGGPHSPWVFRFHCDGRPPDAATRDSLFPGTSLGSGS
jgi:pSer/pThr/pTyr-binding forkhead associated (FHA) protein